MRKLRTGNTHLLLLFMLTTLNVTAQKSHGNSTKVDSLLYIAKLQDDTNAVNARIELFLEYEVRNPYKAKLHLDKASELKALATYTKGLAEVNKYYGYYYSDIGLLDKAEKHIKESINYYKKIKSEKGVIACLNVLGILEGQRGNLSQALEYYLLVKQKSQKIGLTDELVTVNINIGQVHYLLGDYQKAEDFYRIASIQLNNENDLKGSMHLYSKRATNFLALENYEKALKFMNNALDIAIEIKDSIEQITICSNIGSYYSKVGKLDSALIYYTKSSMLAEKMGLRPLVAVNQLHIGLIEYNMGHSDRAIQITEAAIDLAQEVGDELRVMVGYDLLAEIYQSKGNYKLAFETYKKYKLFSDSIEGIAVKNKINELKIVYEVSEKESENKILQEQGNIKKLKIRQLNFLLITFGVVFFLIILVVFLVVRQRKIKSKLIQVELEQKALRTQMNPHFIFNALNSIQRMYIEGMDDVANDYLADFSRLLRTVLENSGKRYISLSEEIGITRLYLDLEKLRTDNLFTYELNIEAGLDPDNIIFPPLILQPYLENAIWHGLTPIRKDGLIVINVFRGDDQRIVIELLDNGIGINQSKLRKKESETKSLGMQITSQRLGGNSYVKIEELETGGTKVTLTIKITK